MRTELLLSRTIAPACFAFVITLAQAQTWTTLTTPPPSGVSSCMLLTDGGAMCQSGSAWYKLTPDSNGNYSSGTWSSLASLPSGYAPLYYASAVLADGRVVIVGGEYNSGTFALTNMGAIYDPKADSWQMITPPSAADFQCIGNAPASLLADGRFLLGAPLFQDLAFLDPVTLSWTIVSVTGKNDVNAQEGWTLLPDGSVFTADVTNFPASERFLLYGPNTGTWVTSGNTLQNLQAAASTVPLQAPGCPAYTPPGQMGPALLRPDGTVFAIGASGFTGIYTPPAPALTLPGTWAAGPALPASLIPREGPAALLPSGHVLLSGSPASGIGLQYFEFDGKILTSVPGPANASSDATFLTQLLVLPTGQILFVDSSSAVQLYTPAASPTYNPSWAPTVSSVPSSLNNATTYHIVGTQFNGLSQGTAYGDEMQNATNYPLVRITNTSSGHIFYARTHDHSTMGVATGTAPVFTNFDVPSSIETGPAALQVVANGISSAPVAVTVFAPNTGALKVATASLPNGQVNVPYLAALSANGGASPYSWQLISGTLPTGLTLNPQTGQIAGTPTSAAAGTRLIFTVTDSSAPSAQTGSISLSLTISSAALTITTASLLNAEADVSYSAQLSASGGTMPYSWQTISGRLPIGLTLNPQTGLISGMPVGDLAENLLTFAVTDSSAPTPQTARIALSFTVISAPLTISTASLPTGQVNVLYSAVVSASGGAAPYSWQLTAGTLPAGLTLNSQTGQIAGTPSRAVAGTLLTLAVTDSSAPTPQTASVTLSLTVTPSTAPSPLTITTASLPNGQVDVTYSAVVSASGGATPYSWQLISGTLPTGLTLNPQTGQIAGTPSSAVANTLLTFKVTDSSTPTAQTASVTLSLSVIPPSGIAVATTSLPNGQVNLPYSATLSASGGATPYSWQLISGTLPTGLTLNPQTGQIAGTPSSAVANTPLTFKVTDSSTPTAQAASVTLSLTVTPPLTITTTSLPNGQVNVPYSAALSANGGTGLYSWQLTAGALPPGLTLNSQTGQIAGTPTSAVANTPLTFKVTDSSTPAAQTASVTLSLTVIPAPLTITTTSLPNGLVTVPYSAALSANGGTTPYSWQVTSGRMPAGLALNSLTGQIAGTPTNAVSGSLVTFTITDSSTPIAQTATVTLTLAVTFSSGLTITTTSLPNGQVTLPYSAALSANGGTTPYNWQLISGTLPTGLALNPQTGQIAGTPTSAVANTLLTFKVTDSSTPSAQTASVTLSLTVTMTSSSGLTITTTSLPNGEVNAPYSAALSATGGTTPYIWQLMSGRLPIGLALNPQTGQISGTPMSAIPGTVVTFTVTDSSTPTAQTASVPLSLTVNP